MPFLSIIIPVYNAEKYLARCIESILRNTFSDWELILIDDGSEDDSARICDQYSQVDDRVVALHQSNQGQSEARNKGLSIAKGRYVTFVDADDEVGDNAYLPNIQYLEAHPEVDFLQYPTIWNCNTPETRKDAMGPITIEGHDALLMAFCDNSPINYSVWNKLFRLKVVRGVRFVSGRLYEDKLFLLDVIRQVNVAYLSEWGEYHYYQYGESSINKPTFLRRISWVESEYVLLEEMYRHPQSRGQWLKRWMDANRYLAVTHYQFPDEVISKQMKMAKQSIPAVRMKASKDYIWYLFIVLCGIHNYIKIYCKILDRSMSNK